MQTSIAVTIEHTELLPQATQLADKLGLPLVQPNAINYQYLLTVTPEHLELRQTGKQAPNPLYVDFLSGKTAWRKAHSTTQNELLAKAVGIKPGYRPSLIDATAGLGRDAFILASLGCTVTLLERSPIIAQLLEDGIQRAQTYSSIHMNLIQTDAIQFLSTLSELEKPDVVYLDPMYPDRKKTALVKKEMRILRDIAGDDNDAEMLFIAAKKTARKRVVVKRPKLGELLYPNPDLCYKGNSSRFDIYLS